MKSVKPKKIMKHLKEDVKEAKMGIKKDIKLEKDLKKVKK